MKMVMEFMFNFIIYNVLKFTFFNQYKNLALKMVSEVAKFVQFNQMFNASNVFWKGNNINDFILNFERQCGLVEIDEKLITSFLINSIEVDAKHELFSQLEFSKNSQKYAWIVDTLKSMFGIKQQNHHSTRDFLPLIRIHAYTI